MTRFVVLIAYESSEWDDASAETRDYYFQAHDAFAAYVAEHGTEHAPGPSRSPAWPPRCAGQVAPATVRSS